MLARASDSHQSQRVMRNSKRIRKDRQRCALARCRGFSFVPQLGCKGGERERRLTFVLRNSPGRPSSSCKPKGALRVFFFFFKGSSNLEQAIQDSCETRKEKNRQRCALASWFSLSLCTGRERERRLTFLRVHNFPGSIRLGSLGELLACINCWLFWFGRYVYRFVKKRLHEQKHRHNDSPN